MLQIALIRHDRHCGRGRLLAEELKHTPQLVSCLSQPLGVAAIDDKHNGVALATVLVPQMPHRVVACGTNRTP
jgi:hypothetical protein